MSTIKKRTASGLATLVVTVGCLAACATDGGEPTTSDASVDSKGATDATVDGSKRACIPGVSVACVGPGGCSGGQACNKSGSGFGTCVCGSGQADGGSKGTDSGPADTGPSDSGSLDTSLVDTGTSDGGAEASTDASMDAPVCAPGTQQCADSSHVETCGSNGQWSDWACVSGACSGGACSGSTTTAASCPAEGGAGLTNCGEGGSGSESCCTSLEVTGGTYFRTYDPLNDAGLPEVLLDGGPTGGADPATVSGFRLDKYLVTVGRFRQFVSAVLALDGGVGWYPTEGSGKHTHLNGGQGLENSGDPGTYETGWDATAWNNTADIDPTTSNLQCGAPYNTWTAAAGSNENLPINCVTWHESYAFCIWDGGFLPSEAEWEYAAAGGSQQREYPWGTAAPGTANQYAIYKSYYTSNPTYIAPVGHASLGAGYGGQVDLAGEVFEWNLDWYAGYVDPAIDCAYLPTAAASYRVLRGGDFDVTASYLLPSYRAYNTPSDRDGSIGFRCARSP